jgi:hypothetical protein
VWLWAGAVEQLPPGYADFSVDSFPKTMNFCYFFRCLESCHSWGGGGGSQEAMVAWIRWWITSSSSGVGVRRGGSDVNHGTQDDGTIAKRFNSSLSCVLVERW